jgi:hypothetical protein
VLAATILPAPGSSATSTKSALSPLQTNQVRGYCGKTDMAYDADEVLDFFERLTFVPKAHQDVCLYIDGYLNGSEWHRKIVGTPELVITKNLLKVIKNVAPQRSIWDYYECHMGLTQMMVPLMFHEETTLILEEQDNIEQS